MTVNKETFTHEDKVRFIDKGFPQHAYDVSATVGIPEAMCICGFSLDDPDHSCSNPVPLREITGHHQKVYLNLVGVGPLIPVSGALLKKVNI